MAKRITCAVALFNKDTKEFLICHPTGDTATGSWSLPKGVADPGEGLSIAAARELFEETSIKISSSSLINVGTFSYRPNKDLQLFLTFMDNPTFRSKTSSPKCTSLFDVNFGNGTPRMIPEVDKFQVIPYNQSDVKKWMVDPFDKIMFSSKTVSFVQKYTETKSEPRFSKFLKGTGILK